MGRRSMLLLFAIATIAIAAACFSPRERDCVISCAGGGGCPSGMQCTADGLCATSAGVECLREAGDGGFGDASIAADAAVPVEVPPDVIGDVFTFTFDSSPFEWSAPKTYVGIDRIVRDRSGRGLNGYVRSPNESGATARVKGRYGEAAPFALDSMREIFVPLEEMPSTFTFEAWIAPELSGDTERALISNSDGVNVYWELYLDGEGHLVFEAANGCGEERTEATSDATVPSSSIDAPDFHYVAATYDHQTKKLKLHVDDVVEEVGLVLDLCPAFNVAPIVLGRRHLDQTSAFEGVMDEVKLSGRVKSNAELQASRAYDSTVLIERCGDGIVEGGEDCEHPSSCCDPLMCRLMGNGRACGVGTCIAGVCVGAAGGLPTPAIRYTFEDGNEESRVVDDVANILPLDIVGDPVWDMDLGRIELLAEDMDVQPQRLESQNPVSVFIEPIVSKAEITVHIRIAPSTLQQDGPARILSIAPDVTRRNITLGQVGPFLVVRTRTSLNTDIFDGMPPLVVPRLQLGPPTDIIYVRTSAGDERIYVDGVLAGRALHVGDFLDWDSAFLLVLGDEVNTSPPDVRPWVGTYELVEIYTSALSADEIGTLATQ